MEVRWIRRITKNNSTFLRFSLPLELAGALDIYCGDMVSLSPHEDGFLVRKYPPEQEP